MQLFPFTVGQLSLLSDFPVTKKKPSHSLVAKRPSKIISKTLIIPSQCFTYHGALDVNAVVPGGVLARGLEGGGAE